MLTTDTSYSPNEGVTSGSQSIEYGGTALRLASAEVRGILLDLAAKRFGVSADTLTVADGTIGSRDRQNRHSIVAQPLKIMKTRACD